MEIESSLHGWTELSSLRARTQSWEEEEEELFMLHIFDMLNIIQGW